MTYYMKTEDLHGEHFHELANQILHQNYRQDKMQLWWTNNDAIQWQNLHTDMHLSIYNHRNFEKL